MRLDARRMIDRPEPGINYEVIAPSIPLKLSPSFESGIETQALRGEIVIVYEQNKGWVWGQLARDKYVGWLPIFLADDFNSAKPKFLSEQYGSAISFMGSKTPMTHKVKVSRTFTYPGENMKQPIIAALSLGSAVHIVEIKGDFVRTARGEYIWAAHLCELDEMAQDFVSVAEQFLHVPYLWGGKTSLGLDCSGLVQISLQAVGIEAPRDSDMQFSELGEAVDLKNVQRGDLVFWRGHVGIMINSSTLLHANGHHMMVVKESFTGAVARIKEKSFGEVIGVKRLG